MFYKQLLLIFSFQFAVVLFLAHKTVFGVLQQSNDVNPFAVSAGLERLAQILARRPAPPLSPPLPLPPTTTASTETTAAPPVSIAVYYETLCPYCRSFIAQQLVPLYKQVSSAVINVTFVPYGNAKELSYDGRNEYVCQHGLQECIGNNIHACLVNSGSTNTDVIMSFIGCTENSTKYPSDAVRECGKSVGVDYAPLERCAYDYHQYSQIMHEYAVLTANARPKVQGVPYVQIDGKYEPDATDNLVMFVCNAYKGRKPEVCAARAHSITTVLTRTLRRMPKLC